MYGVCLRLFYESPLTAIQVRLKTAYPYMKNSMLAVVHLLCYWLPVTAIQVQRLLLERCGCCMAVYMSMSVAVFYAIGFHDSPLTPIRVRLLYC